MEKELKVDKVNAIMQESADTNALIQVTDWVNGEGFDISVWHKNAVQHLSVTWMEFDVIKKSIKKLSNL